MSGCFLFILIFSPTHAVVKQTTKLVFGTTQSICQKISNKCLAQGHNDVMPSIGNEPNTKDFPKDQAEQNIINSLSS